MWAGFSFPNFQGTEFLCGKLHDHPRPIRHVLHPALHWNSPLHPTTVSEARVPSEIPLELFAAL